MGNIKDGGDRFKKLGLLMLFENLSAEYKHHKEIFFWVNWQLSRCLSNGADKSRAHMISLAKLNWWDFGSNPISLFKANSSKHMI